MMLVHRPRWDDGVQSMRLDQINAKLAVARPARSMKRAHRAQRLAILDIRMRHKATPARQNALIRARPHQRAQSPTIFVRRATPNALVHCSRLNPSGDRPCVWMKKRGRNFTIRPAPKEEQNSEMTKRYATKRLPSTAPSSVSFLSSAHLLVAGSRKARSTAMVGKRRTKPASNVALVRKPSHSSAPLEASKARPFSAALTPRPKV